VRKDLLGYSDTTFTFLCPAVEAHVRNLSRRENKSVFHFVDDSVTPTTLLEQIQKDIKFFEQRGVKSDQMKVGYYFRDG
jgi:hypothetical protein